MHPTPVPFRNGFRDGKNPAPTGPRPGPRPMSSLLRAAQTAGALALVALAGLASTTLAAGCGGGGGTSMGGTFCEGGFIREKPTATSPGVCEGLCSASACGMGQVCVDNKCALTCSSQLDCTPLTQDCAPAMDDGKNAVTTCQDTGKGTIGIKCPFGNECTGAFTCMGTKTKCDPKCTGSACPCPADQCLSPFPPAYACPDGKACDPKCTDSTCPCTQDKCNPLVCLGTGTGDADAFCTLEDCHADSDCPGGYWCAEVHDPHPICGNSKLGGLLCGTSTEMCVDPSMDMANGTTYGEGTLCATRNLCRPRKACATCETDLDCSGVPGQHCTTMTKDGSKACTRDCAADKDCEVGFQCTTGACIPRYGSCVGTGKSCEPCRKDSDCGMGFACLSYGGDEHFCMDVTKSCTVDTDCPKGPDGRNGLCANANFQLDSTDPRFDKCFFPPQNSGSGRLSCWCSNPGTACYVKADCCDGPCIGAHIDSNPQLSYPGFCK